MNLNDVMNDEKHLGDGFSIINHHFSSGRPLLSVVLLDSAGEVVLCHLFICGNKTIYQKEINSQFPRP